jgi:ankyrin repeat protein
MKKQQQRRLRKEQEQEQQQHHHQQTEDERITEQTMIVKVPVHAVNDFPIDQYGFTPIHNVICDNSKNSSINGIEVMKVIKRYPTAAQYPNMFGQYPIHYACCYKQPLCVISVLINLCKPALLADDSRGRNPLHYAIAHGQSEEVVMKLLNECPSSSRQKNCVNTYPLHLACQRYNNQCNDVIVTLLDLHLLVVKLQNSLGKTPIDYAKESHQSNTIINILNILSTKSDDELTNRTNLPSIILLNNKMKYTRRYCIVQWLMSWNGYDE